MTVAWSAACPACRAELGAFGTDDMACERCTSTLERVDDIWRGIRSERRSAVNAFLDDYTRIRLAEGRGSDDPAFYLNLPNPSPGDPLAWQWAMRAATWSHVERCVLPGLGGPLRVVDVGAGVGWMSHRLRAVGHDPIAIDLSVDGRDGLGAARHYRETWARVQAEFDALPLAAAQADLVVFNASFQYSTDYEVTLLEARRVLRPGGHVLILDTPVYRRPESGAQMVAERHSQFEERFGVRSDSVASIEYLTHSTLAELVHRVGVRWQHSEAWYGWRWRLRPLRARLAGKREPSRFISLLGSWPTQ